MDLIPDEPIFFTGLGPRSNGVVAQTGRKIRVAPYTTSGRYARKPNKKRHLKKMRRLFRFLLNQVR